MFVLRAVAGLRVPHEQMNVVHEIWTIVQNALIVIEIFEDHCEETLGVETKIKRSFRLPLYFDPSKNIRFSGPNSHKFIDYGMILHELSRLF